MVTQQDIIGALRTVSPRHRQALYGRLVVEEGFVQVGERIGSKCHPDRPVSKSRARMVFGEALNEVSKELGLKEENTKVVIRGFLGGYL